MKSVTEKNLRREERLPEAARKWYGDRKTNKAWTNYVLLQAAENLVRKGDPIATCNSYKPARNALLALAESGKATQHRENLATFWRIL